ncbi:hypothetical protein ACN38_g12925, partial [Penicillium nordicum]
FLPLSVVIYHRLLISLESSPFIYPDRQVPKLLRSGSSSQSKLFFFLF